MATIPQSIEGVHKLVGQEEWFIMLIYTTKYESLDNYKIERLAKFTFLTHALRSRLSSPY